MTVKSDKWIEELGNNGSITPFASELVRKVSLENGEQLPIISYGTSSYGYDLRLSPKEFKVFKHVPGTVVNPKNFSSRNLETALLHKDSYGEYFIIPANSYALGVSLERLKIPRNIIVVVIGKSTYCRCGIICNVSPIESEWEGYLTLEFSNSSSTDCMIFANEGVCQLLFFESDADCNVSYQDRHGKYQNQQHEITLPRV